MTEKSEIQMTVFEETDDVDKKKSHYETFLGFIRDNKSALIKTFCFAYIMFNFGIQQEILGPSVPTLVNRTNSDYQQIGVALGCKSIGLLVGAFFGGAIVDHLTIYNRYLALFFVLLFTMIEFFSVSYVSNIYQISFILLTIGISHSIIGSILNANLSEMWHGKSGPAFIFINFTFGFGAISSTFIVSGFTLEEPEGLNKAHGIISLSEPYGITTIVTFFSTIWVLIHYIIDVIEERRSKNKKFDNKIDAEKKREEELKKNEKCNYYCKKFRNFFLPSFEVPKDCIGVVILVPIIMFFLYGIERVIGGYIFSYLVESRIHLFTKSALYTVSLFWIGFTTGRGIFLILSYFIQVSYLFIFASSGSVISFITFIVIPGQEMYVYPTLFFVGFFTGTFFPSFIATTDQATKISGLIVMSIEIGGGLGSVILNNVIGYVMNNDLEEYYPISLTITSIGLLILTIGFVIIVERIKRNRNIS